ncbi:MAG: carboxymuconolactone decarboxylase family protein [Pseudomonadota bacterium]
MKQLVLHTISTTPERSRKLLQSSIDNFGWIPNQSAYMSESPALLEAYQRAHDLFNGSSLNEEERAVVWITTGRENSCAYTVQAHAFIALKGGVQAAVVQALIDDADTLTPRLSQLRQFTKNTLSCRGQLPKAAIHAFLEHGFTNENMLDVVLGVSQKNMSILLNSIAGTIIDQSFKLDDDAVTFESIGI